MLFFKGEFACLYGYTGDRGSSTVLFASKEQKLVIRAYFESLLEDSNDNSDIIEEELNLTDSYTVFFEQDDEYYYHINSPYWSYSFNPDVKNLYYIEDDDSFTPVEFVQFKINPHTSLYSGETFKSENQFMTLKKTGGYKFEVPFERVIFKVKKEI